MRFVLLAFLMLSPFARFNTMGPPRLAPGGGGGGGYSANVLADSPYLYWRLGETSGSTAVDQMGAHDGTYEGSGTQGVAGLITGDSDKSYDVAQGTANAAIHASIPALSGSGVTALTVECWTKAHDNQYQPYAYFVCEGSPYSGFAWTLGTSGSPTLKFSILSAGNTVSTDAVSSVDVYDNAIHHIVGRWDGTNISIWVDGVKTGQTAFSGTMDAAGASGGVSTPFLVMANYGGSGAGAFQANATVDEVAAWTSALSDARIAAHHAAGI